LTGSAGRFVERHWGLLLFCVALPLWIAALYASGLDVALRGTA
jgi:hypothetical protein